MEPSWLLNLMAFLFGAGLVIVIVSFSVASYNADAGNKYKIDDYFFKAWVPILLGQIMMSVSGFYFLTRYFQDEQVQVGALLLLAFLGIGQSAWIIYFSQIRQRFAA